MGSLQAKSMTSQRYRAVTRWRICVTMATLWQQQDGGYALLFYIFNSTVIDWTCLFLIINSSTINSLYKNAFLFWIISSLPNLRSDLFISFFNYKIFTRYFFDVHLSRRLHVALERNIDAFRFTLWDLKLCWHFVSCCIIQVKENKLRNMASVAYQPFFKQSAAKQLVLLNRLK